MVGKIKLQDAVDDYDWIKCGRCQKLFPKRDYIIHRQEHKNATNNGKRLGGDSGKRLEDKGKRTVEENVTINENLLVRPAGVTRRPGINLAGNRPNIIIKREIPVVTLSSDDDDGNAEINDENLPRDIHIAATTATSATSDSTGTAVQNNRSSELTGSVNSASIPVSVIVERFSEIGGQQHGTETTKIIQNAKSSDASLLEREVPNVEVSNGRSTGSLSKLYKRLQRPGPLSWKKSLERKVSKEKSPPISSALDQLLTCQTCKEVFRTEEELSGHKTKCRCEPESQESTTENSAFIINNRNASELRTSCVTQIEDKGQDDPGRLVVVFRRMSEDDPVTGEKGEYQCVERNNPSQLVAMPSKKPRKRSIESRIQLMKDIQPYVRRAAASKPIRYEENVCPYCDKAFSNYNMVEIHIKKKHEARGVESFKSSAVNQNVISTSRPTIPTKSALSTYQTALVVEPNLPQVKPSRGKEKCEHCGRLFTAKQMIRHALFHAKKKPYKCTNCQKCFVSIAGKRGHQNKCRQYSLAFLPNGEWKRVPFKVSRNGTSSLNYAPPVPGKFKSIAVNMAIKSRGRRRKSRPQHAAASRRSSPMTEGMRETLVEAVPQRHTKTEEKDKNIEQATKEKIQSSIPHNSEASNKSVPMPTKLPESDLKADYNSGVGKRILELLKQLDKAAAATTRDNNVTMHRRKSETAGTPMCWIVKEGQKSITCSLFTKKTTEGTTGKYSCQGRGLSSSSLSDLDTLDCDFCSLKLAPADYLHHVLQHEDCSAYTCPVCLKIYLHSGLYKRHMRLMHGQSGNTRNFQSNNHSNNTLTLLNQSSSSIQFQATGIPHKVSLVSSPQRNMLKRL